MLHANRFPFRLPARGITDLDYVWKSGLNLAPENGTSNSPELTGQAYTVKKRTLMTTQPEICLNKPPFNPGQEFMVFLKRLRKSTKRRTVYISFFTECRHSEILCFVGFPATSGALHISVELEEVVFKIEWRLLIFWMGKSSSSQKVFNAKGCRTSSNISWHFWRPQVQWTVVQISVVLPKGDAIFRSTQKAVLEKRPVIYFPSCLHCGKNQVFDLYIFWFICTICLRTPKRGITIHKVLFTLSKLHPNELCSEQPRTV